jgi:glycosyltransferase involved in cell wall biosynthesis
MTGTSFHSREAEQALHRGIVSEPPTAEAALQKPLLLIDFTAEGHHALYVRHLARFAFTNRLSRFCFLVPRATRDLVTAGLSSEEADFFLSHLRLLEEDPAWARLQSQTKVARVSEWLYVEYLNIYESTQYRLLFLYLETSIYQAAFCPLPRYDTSGLMFRPTFYHRRQGMLLPGLSSRLMFMIKWFAAYMLVRRPGIKRVFLLDPLAAEYSMASWHSCKMECVPDPLGPGVSDLRPLGSADRVTERPITMLIAGALHPRKGIHATVNALARSSETTRRSVRLMLIGKPMENCENYALDNVERLKNMNVEVDYDFRFVSDLELDRYIAQSHVVLTPYLGFKSSSGIVIRAAHFGKPVVSTDDGLLGYLVKKHQLGETLDAGNETSFAACLDRIVATGRVRGFDPARARAFADSCDPDDFAARLFSAA